MARPKSRRPSRAVDPLKRALITPEGVWLDVRLGSAGVRAAAFALDLVIMVGALIVLSLLALLVLFAVGKQAPTLFAVIWLLGFFILRNFYFILFESGARAATIGKRALGLRVVARDGGRLTAGAVVARNMVRELEAFLPITLLPVTAAEGFADHWTAVLAFSWTLLFLFLPLFNRDKLRAGDLIAGTWVVVNERRRIGDELLSDDPETRNALSRIAPFTEQELSVYGQFELQKLEEVLRQHDNDAMTSVAAAIRTKLGRADDRHDAAFLNAYYAALRQHLERKLLFGRRKADKFDSTP